MYSLDKAKREYEEAISAGINEFERAIFEVAIKQAKEAEKK